MDKLEKIDKGFFYYFYGLLFTLIAIVSVFQEETIAFVALFLFVILLMIGYFAKQKLKWFAVKEYYPPSKKKRRKILSKNLEELSKPEYDEKVDYTNVLRNNHERI